MKFETEIIAYINTQLVFEARSDDAIFVWLQREKYFFFKWDEDTHKHK